MEEHISKEASLEATLAIIDKTLGTTEVESLTPVNSAYVISKAESGPLLQYLGAGYYVKRAPMRVKAALEKELVLAKTERENAAASPETTKEPIKTMNEDTIEIVERYDSSDE